MSNITFADFDTGVVDPTVVLNTATVSGVSGSIAVASPGRTGTYSLQLSGPIAQAGWPIFGAPVSVGLRFDFLPPRIAIISSDIAQIQTAETSDLWPTLHMEPLGPGGYTLTVTGSGLVTSKVAVTLPGWHQLQLLVDRVHHTVSFGVDNVIQGPFAYTAPMGQPLFATVINDNRVVGLRGDGTWSETLLFDNVLISDGTFDPITYSYVLPVQNHAVTSEHNTAPARYAFASGVTATGVVTGAIGAARAYVPTAFAHLTARGTSHISRSMSVLSHMVVGVVHGRIQKRAAIGVVMHGTVGSMARGAGTRILRRRTVAVGTTSSPLVHKHPHLTRAFVMHGLANAIVNRRVTRSYTESLNLTDALALNPRVEPITIPQTLSTANIPQTVPTNMVNS